MKTEINISFEVSGQEILKEKEVALQTARQEYHRCLRELDNCIANVELKRKVVLVEETD